MPVNAVSDKAIGARNGVHAITADAATNPFAASFTKSMARLLLPASNNDSPEGDIVLPLGDSLGQNVASQTIGGLGYGPGWNW
ncbi:hypothetical protein JMUB6875_72860 [Nocardia sp. JMUB6875]